MNRTLHALCVIPIVFALSLNLASGQGCVAIRGLSGCGGFTGGGIFLQPEESQAGLNFRYFKSFRHFRGKEEETVPRVIWTKREPRKPVNTIMGMPHLPTI